MKNADSQGQALRQFNALKRTCKYKRIQVDLTFDEWVSWWEKHLGDDWMRIKSQHKIRMCRVDKNGPFSLSNIFPPDSNPSTGGRPSKINQSMIGNILLDPRSSRQLAKSYNVSPSCISKLRLKHGRK